MKKGKETFIGSNVRPFPKRKKTAAKKRKNRGPAKIILFEAIPRVKSKYEYKLFNYKVQKNGDIIWTVVHVPTQKAARFETNQFIRYREILMKMDFEEMATVILAAGAQYFVKAECRKRFELVD